MTTQEIAFSRSAASPWSITGASDFKVWAAAANILVVTLAAAGPTWVDVLANLQLFRDFTHDCRGVRMTSPRHLAHVLRVTMVRSRRVLVTIFQRGVCLSCQWTRSQPLRLQPGVTSRHHDQGIRIFMWPKVIFLYPTAIVALICCFGMWIIHDQTHDPTKPLKAAVNAKHLAAGPRDLPDEPATAWTRSIGSGRRRTCSPCSFWPCSRSTCW